MPLAYVGILPRRSRHLLCLCKHIILSVPSRKERINLEANLPIRTQTYGRAALFVQI